MADERRIPVDDFLELSVSLNDPHTCVIVRPRTPAVAEKDRHAAGRVLALPAAAVDSLVAALLDLRRGLRR